MALVAVGAGENYCRSSSGGSGLRKSLADTPAHHLQSIQYLKLAFVTTCNLIVDFVML